LLCDTQLEIVAVKKELIYSAMDSYVKNQLFFLKKPVVELKSVFLNKYA